MIVIIIIIIIIITTVFISSETNEFNINDGRVAATSWDVPIYRKSLCT